MMEKREKLVNIQQKIIMKVLVKEKKEKLAKIPQKIIMKYH